MSFAKHIPAIEKGLIQLPSLIEDLHRAKDDDGKISWEEGLMIAIKAVIMGLAAYSEDVKKN